jgi:hypothetical protein
MELLFPGPRRLTMQRLPVSISKIGKQAGETQVVELPSLALEVRHGTGPGVPTWCLPRPAL